MALKNLFSLGVLAALTFTPNLVLCQLHVPGPRFEHHDVESADSTRPAATPGIYDYDAQIFAPVEFSNGEELEPKTGFFFSMDRLYTSVSGNNDESGGIGPYYIWGNRYDAGYMNTEDDGWNAVYEQSEGNQFVRGGNILVPNPEQLTTKLASVEINKVYRQQLSRGGWVEPYVGLRYFNVSDSTIQDFLGGVIGGVASNRFTQNVTNSAVGLNIGGRLVKQRGRWRYSNDIAIAPTYNEQRLLASDFTNIAGTVFSTQTSDSNSSFVPAVDYRLEINYNLTRDFGIRGGASVTYLWSGVARANTEDVLENPNSIFGDPTAPFGGLVEEQLLAAGFSFGFEYRR